MKIRFILLSAFVLSGNLQASPLVNSSQLQVSGRTRVCQGLSGSAAQIATALQSCLDSAADSDTVAIPAGTYVVSQVITVRKSIRVTTQGLATDSPACGYNSDGRCAVIRAVSPVSGISRGFFVIGADKVTLDHIVIDGNKNARGMSDEARQCSTLSNNGAGVNIESLRASLTLIGVTSMNALCGSGAELIGANLVVTRSTFLNNGYHTISNMWADGMTVVTSSNATITWNTFIDNTDVQLIFGACPKCTIAHNTITHTGTFAGSSFAALMLHAWPGGTSGDYTGSTISENIINCANDRCGFGLLIGASPWYHAPTQGGLVIGNQIKGAQIGFLINDATNAAVPVQIGPNTVSNSGGVFLSSAGARSVPAMGISPASQGKVAFVQGASARQFMPADLTGAVLNWWERDTIVSPWPITTSNDLGFLPTSSWMTSGAQFKAGEGARSHSGAYGLIVQDDGNVVLYGPYGPVWSSRTISISGARLAMQADGNLVLYNAHGLALWYSRTEGNRGARLAIQDDGNLVIYAANGTPVWHIK